MRAIARVVRPHRPSRTFSSSCSHQAIRGLTELKSRTTPRFLEDRQHHLLSLHWPKPLHNVLLVKKNGSERATKAAIDFARHITTSYPSINLLAEPSFSSILDQHLPGHDVYTTASPPDKVIARAFQEKTDLITTFGGDGTVLHASSLFSTASSVPPMLTFALGTLGFLGEYKFRDHQRAFAEAYTSGTQGNENPPARILLRHRLKVAVSHASSDEQTSPTESPHHALNEVLLHRGSDPHLMHVSVAVNGRFLTEAVADGMLVSTPTGSTAYSLSAGGSIIHPLVPSLLLTPICPRSLSFRPLVLPANAEIVLRLSEKNRGRAMEISVDGDRRREGAHVGMEVRVTGELMERGKGMGENEWVGGVPCLVGGEHKVRGDDDGWVGGLNNLLKWNYPFGEEQ